MGSNFFKPNAGRAAAGGIDPAGATYAQLGNPGSQSTIGRAITNDPLHRFLFGGPKEVNATAGPYAGIAPTLAASQRGYALTPNGQAAGSLQPGNSAQLDATFGKGNY